MRKFSIQVGNDQIRHYYASAAHTAIKRATERLSIGTGKSVEITVLDQGPHVHDYIPNGKKSEQRSLRGLGTMSNKEIPGFGRISHTIYIETLVAGKITQCSCGQFGKPIDNIISKMPLVGEFIRGSDACPECDYVDTHAIQCPKSPLPAYEVQNFIADYEARKVS